MLKRKNMKTIKLIISLATFLVFSTAIQAEVNSSYVSCLKDSFKGGHSFSAGDVRSLCEEISGTSEPSYAWSEKDMTPNNKFTECYDREKKELKALGDKKSNEVAKIVCRYKAK